MTFFLCGGRCFAVTCRGIQFDGGICKILYETTNVSESERTKYNLVSMTSDEENEVFTNGKYEQISKK